MAENNNKEIFIVSEQCQMDEDECSDCTVMYDWDVDPDDVPCDVKNETEKFLQPNKAVVPTEKHIDVISAPDGDNSQVTDNMSYEECNEKIRGQIRKVNVNCQTRARIKRNHGQEYYAQRERSCSC